MKVPVAEIIAIVTEQPVKAGGAGAAMKVARPSGITVRAAPADSPGETDEINVIGCTVEEATRRVDKFLDAAFLARRFRLRIVHGHGKGILRRSLHEMFAGHPHVEKFYAAPQSEGGSGATIVELKL